MPMRSPRKRKHAPSTYEHTYRYIYRVRGTSVEKPKDKFSYCSTYRFPCVVLWILLRTYLVQVDGA